MTEKYTYGQKNRTELQKKCFLGLDRSKSNRSRKLTFGLRTALMLASSTRYGRGFMEIDYEIEIAEPKKFMFDINIKFVIDDNPHTIRIEDVLGGDYAYDKYADIDEDGIFEITINPDIILGFIRNPFKVVIRPPTDIVNYNFFTFRTLTLIDSEYSYIAINKLKSKIDTGEDKELELFKLLKNIIEDGFNFLEKDIEKKRVAEKFNKKVEVV